MRETEHGSAEGQIVGREATNSERFWFDWWRDSPKLNIAILRDLLGRSITLNVGLAGGSAAFLDTSYAHPSFRGLAVVCFLVGLIFACVGIAPRAESVGPFLEDIQKSKTDAFEKMRLWFILSGIAMGIGFGAILLGWFLKIARIL